jgi:hypothetical protein
MNFIEFAIAHGIIIDRPPRLGVWERYPTETHPRKRNGSVKFMGTHGFIQDHAAHSDVILWKDNAPNKISAREVHETIRQAEEARRKLQLQAAARAEKIIGQCMTHTHDYLIAKGFKEEKGLVWFKDRKEFLVIPMRDAAGQIVGAQTISQQGEKKFLYGQKTNGANFMMGRVGVNVLCEGFATGLSIREALRHLKVLARVVVCFSAHNIRAVADGMKPGLVVADHDKGGVGEEAAKKTGWPYWISEREGEDFNDMHRGQGLARAALSLWASLHPGSGGQLREPCNLRSAIRERKLAQDGKPKV